MRTKIFAVIALLGLSGAAFVSCSDSSDDVTPDGGVIGNHDGGLDVATGSDATTDTKITPPADGGADAGPVGACVIPPTHVAIINNTCPSKDTFIDKAVTLPGGATVGGTLPPLN